MTIAYRSNTSVGYDGSTSNSTHTLSIPKPSGLSTTDFLVVSISSMENDSSSRGLTADPTFTGFTKLSEKATFGSSTNRRAWVYYKKITDATSEPANYSFAVSYSFSGVPNMAAVMSRFSGVDFATPVNANSILDGETTSTTLTFGGVTTTVANSMLVLAGYSYRDVTPITYVSGTKIADATMAGASAVGNRITSTMGYLLQSAAEASGDKTATITGATARPNDGLILALNPAPETIINLVNVDNTIYANSSNVTVFGQGLANGVYAKLVYANQEILMVDYVANSTQPYFTSPSLTDVFASRIQFTDSANLQILNAQSGIVATKIVSFQPPTTKTVHNVTDISEILNDGSIYYGQSPAITVNDQIVFDSKSSLTYNVSLDSQGFVTIDSSNTDLTDSFSYRIYESSAQVWGSEGTITFIGEPVSPAGPTYFSKKIKMKMRVT